MDPDDPITVVRHEEQLRVRTVAEPVERIRYEKVVVEEERTITVTVRREELRITREPVDRDEVASGAATPSEDGPRVIEMVLHEEQLTLGRQVVPVERVRVIVDRVVTQEPVDATVAREVVDVDLIP
ncbi:DUF2382 domain-containing protein (plasmid) [Frigoribacterium sp. NBH87]|uniref:DUF2382 domain-containing protein n=1 Tax=Frigoribacterium sp. NBH87 TaxID=2596916 RepID=UPI0016289735|nr:DUF2382 domain-containing protein [Frigoribacterium sp. NBH87]QNE45413.1 DUF2382 domain-containing protein [Frigoribacterium sp. NBH87]